MKNLKIRTSGTDQMEYGMTRLIDKKHRVDSVVWRNKAELNGATSLRATISSKYPTHHLQPLPASNHQYYFAEYYLQTLTSRMHTWYIHTSLAMLFSL